MHTTHTHRGSFLQVLLQYPHQASLDTCTFVPCSSSAAEIFAVHDQAHIEGGTHTCTEAWEHKYRYTYTCICTYTNTCWALWFSQLQPIATRSPTQSRSEKAGKEGVQQTRAAPLGHVHPPGQFSRDCFWCWLVFQVSLLYFTYFLVKIWIVKGQFFFFFDNQNTSFQQCRKSLF